MTVITQAHAASPHGHMSTMNTALTVATGASKSQAVWKKQPLQPEHNSELTDGLQELLLEHLAQQTYTSMQWLAADAYRIVALAAAVVFAARVPRVRFWLECSGVVVSWETLHQYVYAVPFPHFVLGYACMGFIYQCAPQVRRGRNSNDMCAVAVEDSAQLQMQGSPPPARADRAQLQTQESPPTARAESAGVQARERAAHDTCALSGPAPAFARARQPANSSANRQDTGLRTSLEGGRGYIAESWAYITLSTAVHAPRHCGRRARGEACAGRAGVRGVRACGRAGVQACGACVVCSAAAPL